MPTNQQMLKNIIPYALLSLGCFFCGLLLIGLLFWKAELLTKLGLTGYFYYIILLPLALSVAGFLFGVLRSYGRYSGKLLGGTLELGGPIVGFMLVLILGFTLPSPATNFPLTVYVHGERGPQELVLRNSGYVLLDLKSERRKERIGENGQAVFSEIPANFRGQKVNISVEDDFYELAYPNKEYKLEGNSLYLPVRKKTGRITGFVQDESGRPIAGAKIIIADLTTITYSSGRFDLVVPSDKMQKELSIQVFANGYNPWKGSVIPNSDELTVMLER